MTKEEARLARKAFVQGAMLSEATRPRARAVVYDEEYCVYDEEYWNSVAFGFFPNPRIPRVMAILLDEECGYQYAHIRILADGSFQFAFANAEKLSLDWHFSDIRVAVSQETYRTILMSNFETIIKAYCELLSNPDQEDTDD